ncbi:protein VACUOLELESS GAMETOPHYTES-like [Daucus carota subsp. sativus]|uniref:protein VACUOLELESS GAMETOPHYTES-like n=1 Tax=Daucus carota subsp. sativus TaxID=79200 RepID=UPI003082A343
MSGSTVEHFSHPEHLLKLKEDVVIEADATCSVCDQSVIGSPTYTCSSNKIGCESFYLHKSCAQLPTEIVRPTKDQHPLALQPKPVGSFCDICSRDVKFAYACDDCNMDICIICHQGD